MESSAKLFQRMYNQRYKAKYPDRVRATQNKYYHSHREKILELHQKYRERHRDKTREWALNYYYRNKEKVLEKAKLYYQKNREKLKKKKVENLTSLVNFNATDVICNYIDDSLYVDNEIIKEED